MQESISIVGVHLTTDLILALKFMAKVDGKHIGISSYARELLERGVTNQTLPPEPENKLLNMRVSQMLKQRLDMTADELEMNRSEFVRRILARELNLAFDDANEAGDIRRTKFPLLLRGLVLSLAVVIIGFVGFFMKQSVEIEDQHDPVLRAIELPDDQQVRLKHLEHALFEATLQRGIFYFENKEYEPARLDLESARELKETDVVLTYLSRTYHALGDRQKAEQILEILESN